MYAHERDDTNHICKESVRRLYLAEGSMGISHVSSIFKGNLTQAHFTYLCFKINLTGLGRDSASAASHILNRQHKILVSALTNFVQFITTYSLPKPSKRNCCFAALEILFLLLIILYLSHCTHTYLFCLVSANQLVRYCISLITF